VNCADCALWELRHEVTLRVACYLNIQIRDLALLATVIDDVVGRWAVTDREHRLGAGFDAFFKNYCHDVERDADPEVCRAGGQPWEFRRVWHNHAVVLAGEPDRVCLPGEYEVTDGE
jgi:hypothetical protein